MAQDRQTADTTVDHTGVGLDDMAVTWFHRRLTVYSAGGPFLDGYALAIIGVALAQLAPTWHLNAVAQGIMAASALIGLLVGGLIGGYATDRFGRTLIYMLDLLLVALTCVAQFFVQDPVALTILRFVMGIAIGADYPVATSLLAEFVPRRKRGSLLGWLTTMWAAGSAVAYIVGGLLQQIGPDAWRWMLLSPAIPAVILVAARRGTPESPRWLLAHGKREKAEAALHRAFGPDATLESIEDEFNTAHATAVDGQGSIAVLRQPRYRRRLVFVVVFWTCSILPIYAIYSFAPALMSGFHLTDTRSGTVSDGAIGVLFLIGCVVATLLANRFRRRSMLIPPFIVATLGLLGLGLFPTAPAAVIVVLFAVYAIAIGGPTILQWIYPNELFPTHVRATAVGIGTAVSRVGAAAGTFLTPILLGSIGVGPTMLIAVVISIIGIVVSVAMAPETGGKPLLDAAARTAD